MSRDLLLHTPCAERSDRVGITDQMVDDLCRGSDCVCDARDGCSEGSDQTGEAEDYSDPKCSV